MQRHDLFDTFLIMLTYINCGHQSLIRCRWSVTNKESVLLDFVFFCEQLHRPMPFSPSKQPAFSLVLWFFTVPQKDYQIGGWTTPYIIVHGGVPICSVMKSSKCIEKEMTAGLNREGCNNMSYIHNLNWPDYQLSWRTIMMLLLQLLSTTNSVLEMQVIL